MRRFVVLGILAAALALSLFVGASNAPTVEATLPIDVSAFLQVEVTPDVPPGARWEGAHAVLHTNCVGPNSRAIFALPEERFGDGTTRLTADLTRQYTPRGWRLLTVEFKEKNTTAFSRVDGTYFPCTPQFADLAILVFESASDKTAQGAMKLASKTEARNMVKKVAEDEEQDLASLNGKLYAVDGETLRIIVLRVKFQYE